MLMVFGAVSELAREYILQRQQEGVVVAKQMGKYKGRRWDRISGILRDIRKMEDA